MSKRKKVLPSLKELKADLKGMTFKQKVDHLWTYYKGYLFAFLIGVLMVSIVVSAYINSGKKLVVSGMMCNVRMEQAGYDYLTKDYAKELGCDRKTELVELYTSDFSSLEDPTSSEDNYYAAQQFILRVSSDVVDYAVMDEFAMKFYSAQGVFADLRDIFPEEMMAEFEAQDMLYYNLIVPDDTDLDNLEVDLETAERIPIGIKMQKLDFVQDVMWGGEYYFCVAGNTPDAEKVVAVWDYILAWEE